MRGADAVNAAIARRQPHRAAAIGAEREVYKPAGDRGRRSAGRAAGNPPRCARVGGRAVMHVLAVEAVSQFVGMRFSDHLSAGREHTFNRRCCALSRLMGVEPHGIAVAGAMAGDVEHVLHGEGQTAQRTVRRPVHLDMRMAAKSVVRIVWDHCGRCSCAGWRDTVLRPRLKA